MVEASRPHVDAGGPARAGLFVYATDLERLASFYEALAGMRRLHQTAELVVLQSPDIQLLIHRVPRAVADDIVITSPPQRRDRTALKFFFTVAGIGPASALANRLGGAVFAEQWAGPGFVARNACDPEGNVFQIRESVAQGQSGGV